jgi:lipopolysaccharide transport system permease protein
VSAAREEPGLRTFTIRPGNDRVLVDAAELWRSRELLYLLVWRDLKVRYKQTFLGVSWIFLQATLATLVFSLFFSRMSGSTESGLPYPLFALAGVVPWLLFANGVTSGTTSLVANEQLVRRVYVPRYLIPLGAVLAGLVDGALGLALLFALALVYGLAPTASWLLLPFVLALCAATTLALAAILAALTVRFRDVQHVAPFFTQILLFLSPVVYPSTILSEPWRSIYALNPLVGIIEAMRFGLGAGTPPPILALMLSVFTTTALLLGGSALFRRIEREFADIL